jgi:hypothetical protein
LKADHGGGEGALMHENEQLILRRTDPDREAYWVIWRGLKVGSIARQQGASQRTFWRWCIYDAGRPYRELVMGGDALGRDDAMQAFRKAWDLFAADPDRLQHVIRVHADLADRSKRWGPGGG